MPGIETATDYDIVDIGFRQIVKKLVLNFRKIPRRLQKRKLATSL